MSRLVRDITGGGLSHVATLHLDDGSRVEVGRDDLRRILEQVRVACPWCGEYDSRHDEDELDPFDDWPEGDEL
ncbi:hypothetical protein [Brachybacterium paraconglomeratum]|uniref:hypothetical protein n=1 Tax=Brachybacterium paraconglomeratum TaxID=173362 RepID=UPI0022AF75DF|nr:hypothetical protein [Brachybacterium paraconglomeratum]MCZ4325692.1 hypothetical protein [Brachybacterium paraconglomeratum]